MKFIFNNLGRGFLYTIGKVIAIATILILLGFAFARFPVSSPSFNKYDFIGGYFNEK